MNEDFRDQTLTIDTVFGALRVTVTAEALRALRNEAAGPSNEAELIGAHQDLIVQMATMKFEADEGEDNHSVRITDTDIET